MWELHNWVVRLFTEEIINKVLLDLGVILVFFCFFTFVTSVYIDFLNLVLLWVVVGRFWNTVCQLF